MSHLHKFRSTQRPILLVADHKWRDLPGMARLKTILEDMHGLPTVVASYGHVGACLWHYRPRAVVLTTLIGPREQKLARAGREIGAAIAVIPTEGIPGSRDSMGGMLRDAETWTVCDLYLPWGQAMAEFAVEEGYMSADKVRVTGSARFDFYQHPLRRLLPDGEELRVRHGLRAGAPVVTWATTYTLASYLEDEKRLRYNQRDFLQRGLAQIEGFADLRRLAEEQREAQRLALEWMRAASLRFPSVEFVIKPHPYETASPYEALVARCRREGVENLHVALNEYVWNLLSSASMHVHGGSTTGMEAWMMGIPTINLKPGGYTRYKGATGGALPRLDDLDDNQEDGKPFIDRLAFYLDGGVVEPTLRERRRVFLEEWFSKLDGRAAERQAAAIADLVSKPLVPHRPDRPPPILGYRTCVHLLQYRVNAWLNRPLDAPLGWKRGAESVDFLGQRDKAVTQTDVEVWAARIRGLSAGVGEPWRP